MSPETTAQRRGARAEQAALDHLERHGLRLVARNFRCRQGEIDLVMRDGAALVFVEVRLRRDRRFGDAGESVGARKQARLVRAARQFLLRHPHDAPCRFDVVAFDDGDPRPGWIRDAFDAGEAGR